MKRDAETVVERLLLLLIDRRPRARSRSISAGLMSTTGAAPHRRDAADRATDAAASSAERMGRGAVERRGAGPR